MGTEPLIEMRGITKSFGPVEVLHGVSLDFSAGQVHAVLGENGAGKSTLMNILAGVYSDFGGTYLIEGHAVHFTMPLEAQRQGIVMIHQERQVIEQLSVAENIFLGQLENRSGLVQWSAVAEQARAALAELGVDLDPARRVRDLNPGQVKLVEIVRALQRRPRVLIMDEPTAALTPSEIDALFGVVLRYQRAGGAVIYISHHIPEVFRIADRVSVLRDGALVLSTETRATTVDDLIHAMVGRALDLQDRQTSKPGSEVVLEVTHLRTPTGVQDVSLKVHRGEIVGLAGLIGSRRTETALAIFGADPWRGEMVLDGKPYAPRSPADAIAAGVLYLPEDRATNGLLLEAPVMDNLALTRLRQIRRGLTVDKDRLRSIALNLIGKLHIVPPEPNKPVGQFSGGNQQKVSLGKSFLDDARLLILDEPTRGVDVGAKADIHRLITEQAAAGRAVLLISSDVPEIRSLAHRVVILHRGRVAAELSGDAATQEAVVEAATMGRSRAGGEAAEAADAPAAAPVVMAAAPAAPKTGRDGRAGQ
jgi:ABC-type sugar transport system ATPase subunit